MPHLIREPLLPRSVVPGLLDEMPDLSGKIEIKSKDNCEVRERHYEVREISCNDDFLFPKIFPT
jgi:hypothetical protein